MKKLTYSFAALAAGSLLSFSANSAIINLTFEGTTTETCTTCVAAGVAVTAVYSLDTDNAFNAFGNIQFQTADFTISDTTYSISNSQSESYIYGTDIEIFEFTAETIDLFSANNQFYGFLSTGFGPLTGSDSLTWYQYDTGLSYTGDFSLNASALGLSSLGNAYIKFFGSGAFEAGYQTNTFTVSTVSAVPIPAAVWLFASGLAGLISISRRRNSSK